MRKLILLITTLIKKIIDFILIIPRKIASFFKPKKVNKNEITEFIKIFKDNQISLSAINVSYNDESGLSWVLSSYENKKIKEEKKQQIEESVKEEKKEEEKRKRGRPLGSKNKKK